MAVIWMLSSLPARADKTIGGVFMPEILQKAAHVVVYGVLGVAWFWAFDFRRGARAAALWACSLTTAYAAVDEFHQTFVPGRHGSSWDVALDTIAALLVLAIIVIPRRRQRAPK
jgi:VanZ family protein